MLKRIVALFLVVMTLTMSMPALAATPVIKKTEYEGSGYVEVDFKKNVQYKNAKVTVKDSSGKKYTAKITEKDSDDMTFKINSFKTGKTYTYTISGVRSGKSGKYVSIKGTVKIPAAKKVTIKELEYDRGDRELELEFNRKVQYKSLKVTVKDSSGNKYTTKILDKENDGLEIYVKGLKKGKKYTVTVSKVRPSGSGTYKSVSKTFTA